MRAVPGFSCALDPRFPVVRERDVEAIVAEQRAEQYLVIEPILDHQDRALEPGRRPDRGNGLRAVVETRDQSNVALDPDRDRDPERGALAEPGRDQSNVALDPDRDRDPERGALAEP